MTENNQSLSLSETTNNRIEEVRSTYQDLKEKFWEQQARVFLKSFLNTPEADTIREERKDTKTNRKEARLRLDNYITQEEYAKTNQNKVENIRSELQQAESNESLSKAPKWTGKLHYDPEAPADNETSKQPTLNREYDGTTHTYARLDGIEKSFQKQGIEVKDFDNPKEATLYLKEIFRNYKDKFPELWEKDNWFNLDSSMLYKTLLWPNWALKSVPYAGFQDSTGERRRSGNGSFLWLPLRVRGRFVYIWSGRNVQGAKFTRGGEEDAILVAGFED